jgi:hypothetical protein
VHAVSATGADARDGGYPRIAPVGVLDPLLVLLARAGFLSEEGLDAESRDAEEYGAGLRGEWSR